MTIKKNSYKLGPDSDGNFGLFGGRYVAETLMPLIIELERAYSDAINDPKFSDEIKQFSKDYIGSCLLYTSPSPRDRTRSRMPSSA